MKPWYLPGNTQHPPFLRPKKLKTFIQVKNDGAEYLLAHSSPSSITEDMQTHKHVNQHAAPTNREGRKLQVLLLSSIELSYF